MASIAEGPGAAPATGAPPREERIEQRAEHAATVAAGDDTQGRLISNEGACPPVSEIRSIVSVRSSG
jgi:hypothetical protein